MIIKRFITVVIALALAFTVSTAMAGKSDKSDKSDKSWKYSEKSDKSDKSRKGKKGKKGKNSGKSDKSAKSEKSEKSEKSGKSDKESPMSCFSDWEFFPDEPDIQSEVVESGVIIGTACTADDVTGILDREFNPHGNLDTSCYVDPDFGGLPDLEAMGPYTLGLKLTCETGVILPPSDPPEI